VALPGLTALTYLSGQGVVGVGKVDSCGTHLVDLLAVAGSRVGQVDDVEDLGPPKPVICTHAREVRAFTRAP
jgi:hypothetical protein